MNFIDEFIARTKEKNLLVLYAQMRVDGEVKEEYKICPNKTRLNTMSVSKSVVSAAVGLAEEEGILKLDEKICDAFPDYVPANASPYLLDTTITHMLTMTTGLKDSLFKADNCERYIVKDWISYFFNAEFDHAPGERFVYSNFNTFIVSALIETRCGENLLNYLRNRLFEPIGIGNPDWTLSPDGHVYAANGWFATLDEFANFGELLMYNGNWKGQQILPAEYVKKATSKQVESFTRVNATYGDTFGYGYFIWMTPIPGTFLLSGNYGQFCLLIPKKNIELTVMSFEGNNHKLIRDILVDMAKELL